jgi:hypothetical protein
MNTRGLIFIPALLCLASVQLTAVESLQPGEFLATYPAGLAEFATLVPESVRRSKIYGEDQSGRMVIDFNHFRKKDEGARIRQIFESELRWFDAQSGVSALAVIRRGPGPVGPGLYKGMEGGNAADLQNLAEYIAFLPREIRFGKEAGAIPAWLLSLECLSLFEAPSHRAFHGKADEYLHRLMDLLGDLEQQSDAAKQYLRSFAESSDLSLSLVRSLRNRNWEKIASLDVLLRRIEGQARSRGAALFDDGIAVTAVIRLDGSTQYSLLTPEDPLGVWIPEGAYSRGVRPLGAELGSSRVRVSYLQTHWTVPIGGAPLEEYRVGDIKSQYVGWDMLASGLKDDSPYGILHRRAMSALSEMRELDLLLGSGSSPDAVIEQLEAFACLDHVIEADVFDLLIGAEIFRREALKQFQLSQ